LIGSLSDGRSKRVLNSLSVEVEQDASRMIRSSVVTDSKSNVSAGRLERIGSGIVKEGIVDPIFGLRSVVFDGSVLSMECGAFCGSDFGDRGIVIIAEVIFILLIIREQVAVSPTWRPISSQ